MRWCIGVGWWRGGRGGWFGEPRVDGVRYVFFFFSWGWFLFLFVVLVAVVYGERGTVLI